MFEYYGNTLCVQGGWLEETGVVSVNALKVMLHRGKIKKARTARGLGNYALYVYESLPQRFRNNIEHDLGLDPYAQSKIIPFSKYLKYDETAAAFFSNYELEDGRYLSEASTESVEEYTANAIVFNAIQILNSKVVAANPKINKGELWSRITTSIHNLSQDIKARYPFNLPTNPRSLRAKYESCVLQKANKRYPRTGLEGLIHDNYCNNHSTKITQEIGEWLLAFYCLPINTSIYELLQEYNKVRCERGWSFLSESGIANFIMKPENERIWTLAREGVDSYTKKYGHTLSKDKKQIISKCTLGD